MSSFFGGPPGKPASSIRAAELRPKATAHLNAGSAPCSTAFKGEDPLNQ